MYDYYRNIGLVMLNIGKYYRDLEMSEVAYSLYKNHHNKPLAIRLVQMLKEKKKLPFREYMTGDERLHHLIVQMVEIKITEVEPKDVTRARIYAKILHMWREGLKSDKLMIYGLGSFAKYQIGNCTIIIVSPKKCDLDLYDGRIYPLAMSEPGGVTSAIISLHEYVNRFENVVVENPDTLIVHKPGMMYITYPEILTPVFSVAEYVYILRNDISHYLYKVWKNSLLKNREHFIETARACYLSALEMFWFCRILQKDSIYHCSEISFSTFDMFVCRYFRMESKKISPGFMHYI